eukprot:6292195-Prymnesium_polylepis.1
MPLELEGTLCPAIRIHGEIKWDGGCRVVGAIGAYDAGTHSGERVRNYQRRGAVHERASERSRRSACGRTPLLSNPWPCLDGPRPVASGAMGQ